MDKDKEDEIKARIILENFVESFEFNKSVLLEHCLGVDYDQADTIKVDFLEPKYQCWWDDGANFLILISKNYEEPRLVQISITTENDNDQIYKSYLYDKEFNYLFGMPIEHFIIYLGNDPLTITTKIDVPPEENFKGIHFEVKALRFKDFPVEPFLNSKHPECIINAVLCKDGGTPENLTTLMTNLEKANYEIDENEYPVMLKLFELIDDDSILDMSDRHLDFNRLLGNWKEWSNLYKTAYYLIPDDLIDGYKESVKVNLAKKIKFPL